MKYQTARGRDPPGERRSPRGGRGLKFVEACELRVAQTGRSPRGGRGLKSTIPATRALAPRSLSSRRAWIEIGAQGRERHMGAGRSPRGGRGLKFLSRRGTQWDSSRSPRGGRGLKFIGSALARPVGVSLSSRRAWIEIGQFPGRLHASGRRSPRGGRGLKLLPRARPLCRRSRRSPRGGRGLK